MGGRDQDVVRGNAGLALDALPHGGRVAELDHVGRDEGGRRAGVVEHQGADMDLVVDSLERPSPEIRDAFKVAGGDVDPGGSGPQRPALGGGRRQGEKEKEHRQAETRGENGRVLPHVGPSFNVSQTTLPRRASSRLARPALCSRAPGGPPGHAAPRGRAKGPGGDGMPENGSRSIEMVRRDPRGSSRGSGRPIAFPPMSPIRACDPCT